MNYNMLIFYIFHLSVKLLLKQHLSDKKSFFYNNCYLNQTIAYGSC